MTDTAEQVRFPGPDEIEGFWAFDKMHAPRPLHPLSQDLVMSTLAVGFTKAQGEYDCPVVASNQAINHYFYMSFHPHPDEAVIKDRMSRYLDTLDKKVPLVGKRWTNEWLPMIRSRNEAERNADYSGMSNAELLAKFDDMTDWMTEMWYVHGHINFALLSGAKLSDYYAEVMQPDDPTEAYQILQGHHTRPVDAAHGLWRLSRIARDSKALHKVFDENHPRELAKKLSETDEGRAFLDQLNEYLFDFGWRSDAVYDIADVPWRENPSIPLGNIARYINLPDEDDPMIQYERAVKHREDLTAKIRAALADDPDELAKFDEYYEAAQYAVPLTEDHAFYIDQMGVVLLRTFVLAVGDALVRDGVLDSRDDVFFLYRDEVRAALTDGGDQKATVNKRRASVEAAAQASPPGAVGTPPPPPQPGGFVDPFMDALVTRLLGIKPPAEGEQDPDVIDGV
ncbi:MAG: rifampicin phosphotransferase, partial [Ilumatobacteraceae bacterium]